MAHMSVVSIFNIGIKLMTWLNIYKLTKVCKIEEFIKILKWWLQYVGIRINELLGRVIWARNCNWCCSYKKIIKFIAQQFVNEQFCRGINLPLRIKFTKKGESYSFWRLGILRFWRALIWIGLPARLWTASSVEKNGPEIWFRISESHVGWV